MEIPNSLARPLMEQFALEVLPASFNEARGFWLTEVERASVRGRRPLPTKSNFPRLHVIDLVSRPDSRTGLWEAGFKVYTFVSDVGATNIPPEEWLSQVKRDHQSRLPEGIDIYAEIVFVSIQNKGLAAEVVAPPDVLSDHLHAYTFFAPIVYSGTRIRLSEFQLQDTTCLEGLGDESRGAPSLPEVVLPGPVKPRGLSEESRKHAQEEASRRRISRRR